MKRNIYTLQYPTTTNINQALRIARSTLGRSTPTANLKNYHIDAGVKNTFDLAQAINEIRRNAHGIKPTQKMNVQTLVNVLGEKVLANYKEILKLAEQRPDEAQELHGLIARIGLFLESIGVEV